MKVWNFKIPEFLRFQIKVPNDSDVVFFYIRAFDSESSMFGVVCLFASFEGRSSGWGFHMGLFVGRVERIIQASLINLNMPNTLRLEPMSLGTLIVKYTVLSDWLEMLGLASNTMATSISSMLGLYADATVLARGALGGTVRGRLLAGHFPRLRLWCSKQQGTNILYIFSFFSFLNKKWDEQVGRLLGHCG